MTLAYQDEVKPCKINIVSISEEFAIMATGQMKETIVVASDNGQPVTGLAFSNDGVFLHVSIDSGKQLNTYSVERRQLIKEVGRGKQPATVNSMSCDGMYLAACSERGTTHLFNISTGLATSTTVQPPSDVQDSNTSEESKGQGSASGSTAKNTYSKLYYLGYLNPYYSREFSFSQLRHKDADRSDR